MSRHALLLVTTNPVSPDKEQEFNTWYNETHIPEIVERIPGITGARRYEAASSNAAVPDHRYLAIYEIDDPDPTAVAAQLAEAVAIGELTSTDTLQIEPRPGIVLFDAI